MTRLPTRRVRHAAGSIPARPPGSTIAAWQLLARGVIVVLALAAVAAARGAAPGLLVVLVTIGAIAAAVLPDTPAGLAVVGLVGWLWCTQVEADVTGWTLLAALAVGAFHVVTAFAAVLPAGAAWDGATAAVWARRLGTVLAATTVMWAVAFGLSRTAPTSNAALFGAGVLAAASLAWVLRTRSVGAGGSEE